jgi:hypothetical protein
MIKIFMTVRNRLAITQKAIEALEKHTTCAYQLYIYNNATSYLVDEHFDFFRDLYKQKRVTQVSFTTEEATFNAFSKASTCNFFGLQHQQDPKKGKYDFLVMMDNDIIVLPKWNERALAAWRYIKNQKMTHIYVVSQLPGGIKGKTPVTTKIPGLERMAQGKLGGSGFWVVQPDFFDKVGFLPLQQLVNQDKKHDQLYWNLLTKASGGNNYIVGVRPKFGIHCGPCAGSVCNRLTRNRGNKNRLQMIEFKEQEENIGSMTFKQFWKWITEEKTHMLKDW